MEKDIIKDKKEKKGIFLLIECLNPKYLIIKPNSLKNFIILTKNIIFLILIQQFYIQKLMF